MDAYASLYMSILYIRYFNEPHLVDDGSCGSGSLKKKALSLQAKYKDERCYVQVRNKLKVNLSSVLSGNSVT